ncbi:MAG TPA: alpha/beta family hydrolase [Gemmatimonadales bacterium]|nr:alpha/beta family hydrolase [Gemmatimonadales bacterium]
MSRLSVLLQSPSSPRVGYVLAHGAGAGMRHPFLEAIALALSERGVATLRYEFSYMEAGRNRPDPPPVAAARVREAVARAGEEWPGLPLLAGGKSFGGRMTSTAQAEEPLPGVHGLAFLGFPLHPPGKPGTSRAEHLFQVHIPMLFLQGTRDEFARLELLTGVCKQLGPRGVLHLIPDGDHSFKVPRRAGRSAAQVMADLADRIAEFGAALAPR